MTSPDNILKQLSGLKATASVADKRHAAKILSCHVVTIERYLRGQVVREVFARQIIKVLNRIKNDRP